MAVVVVVVGNGISEVVDVQLLAVVVVVVGNGISEVVDVQLLAVVVVVVGIVISEVVAVKNEQKKIIFKKFLCDVNYVRWLLLLFLDAFVFPHTFYC